VYDVRKKIFLLDLLALELGSGFPCSRAVLSRNPFVTHAAAFFFEGVEVNIQLIATRTLVQESSDVLIKLEKYQSSWMLIDWSFTRLG
jgi:hypothetical protein